MPIQQSALKNLTVVTIAMRRVGRGGGGGDDTREDDDDDNDEDHNNNNNTTIKRCTGERGADDDSGNRQLAFGDVDDDRLQRIKAPGGENDDGLLGRRFGRGGG